jgi:two-component system, LytTR family, sensor kinase
MCVRHAALDFRRCDAHDVRVSMEVPVRIDAGALPLGQNAKPDRNPGAKHDAKKIRYPGYGILFAAWTLMGSLSYLHHRLLPGAPPENVLFGLSGWLGCYYAWIPLTPIVFFLERRFPVWRPFSFRNAAILILSGIPFCYAAFELSIVFSRAVHLAFWNRIGIERFLWRIPTSEIALQFFVYAVTVVASAFIRFLIDTQQKEREAAELALEKSELEGALRLAELETLRMRLNPHFLFNCLQNISALAGQDAKTATQMLARLGDLLRVALRSDYKDEIALSEEVALTRAYISIEQVRFGNRLSVLFDIAPETERVLVPNLLLQPLVENAIKHGIGGREKAGVIWVQSTLGRTDQGSELVLTIRDNGVGLPVTNAGELRLGVGLGATKERLMRMYDRQSLEIQPLPEGGAEVRIVLPAHAFARTADETAAVTDPMSSRAAVYHG